MATSDSTEPITTPGARAEETDRILEDEDGFEEEEIGPEGNVSEVTLANRVFGRSEPS